MTFAKGMEQIQAVFKKQDRSWVEELMLVKYNKIKILRKKVKLSVPTLTSHADCNLTFIFTFYHIR